jgi:hypothetical protein
VILDYLACFVLDICVLRPSLPFPENCELLFEVCHGSAYRCGLGIHLEECLPLFGQLSVR